MSRSPSSRVREAARRIGDLGVAIPSLACVAGSGLSGLADAMEAVRAVPFGEIPHMPASGVVGHAGGMYLGRLGGAPFLLLAGRKHLYEGASVEDVVFAMRLLAELGVLGVVLTNAAGGLDPSLRPGDLMAIRDQINLMFASLPPDIAAGERQSPCDPAMLALACDAARAEGVALREGVYVGVAGPSYETRAEIGALRTMGAHAVGMSTVLESIAAQRLGLRTLGISLITNICSEAPDRPLLTHDEVLRTGLRAQSALGALLARLARAFAGAGIHDGSVTQNR